MSTNSSDEKKITHGTITVQSGSSNEIKKRTNKKGLNVCDCILLILIKVTFSNGLVTGKKKMFFATK